MLLNKLRQTGGGNRVCHHRTTGAFFKRNARRQRYKTVAVDFLSAPVHSAAAVHVGVKNHTKVCAAFGYRFANGAHRLFVFRIGNMIREHTVRFQIT